MKKVIRITAIGMVVALLAACGGTNEPQEQREVTGPSLTEREPSPYDFEETWMDLNGRTITMLAVNARNLWDYDFFDPERTMNETLRVMDILGEIGHEYNASIEVFWHTADGLMAMLGQNRTAGDAPFDLFELNLSDFTVNNLWRDGHVMPVTHPEIVDIIKPHDNPWRASEFTTFGETQFAVHFRPFNTTEILRDIIVFNESHRQTFGLPCFYDMVRQGEWTWENFDRILNDVWVQSNNTVHPIVYWHESSIIPIFIASNNGRIAERMPNGSIQFVGDINDNALDAMHFVQSMALRNGFIHPRAPRSTHFIQNDTMGRIMASGEAFFAFSEYALIRNLTRHTVGYESDYDFGIIPPPVGPNGTGITTSVSSELLYHVMADIRAPREAAAILVAIANRTAQRTYRVIQYESNYSLQSSGSAEMLELLLNNVVIDISRIPGQTRQGGGQGIVAAGLRILRGEHTPIQAMQYIQSQVQVWYSYLDDLCIVHGAAN